MLYNLSSKACNLIESGEIGDYIWRYIDIEEYEYYQDLDDNRNCNKKSTVSEVKNNKLISILYKSSFLVVIMLLAPWVYINIMCEKDTDNTKLQKERTPIMHKQQSGLTDKVNKIDTTTNNQHIL